MLFFFNICSATSSGKQSPTPSSANSTGSRISWLARASWTQSTSRGVNPSSKRVLGRPPKPAIPADMGGFGGGGDSPRRRTEPLRLRYVLYRYRATQHRDRIKGADDARPTLGKPQRYRAKRLYPGDRSQGLVVFPKAYSVNRSGKWPLHSDHVPYTKSAQAPTSKMRERLQVWMTLSQGATEHG